MLADRGHPSHGTAPRPTSLTPALYPASQEAPPRGCSHREHQGGETSITVRPCPSEPCGLRPLLPGPSSSNPTAWMGDRPAHLRSPVLEPPGSSFLTHLLSACSTPGTVPTVPGLRVQPRTKQAPVLLGLPFRCRERGQHRADRWTVLQRRAGQRGEALSRGREGSARPRQGGPRRAQYWVELCLQSRFCLASAWFTATRVLQTPRAPPHLACPSLSVSPYSRGLGQQVTPPQRPPGPLQPTSQLQFPCLQKGALTDAGARGRQLRGLGGRGPGLCAPPKRLNKGHGRCCQPSDSQIRTGLLLTSSQRPSSEP